MTVTEISIKAKEAGMSYGEYVNQMGANSAPIEKPKPNTKECPVCGERFAPLRGNRKYCSEECRIGAGYARSTSKKKEIVADMPKKCENLSDLLSVIENGELPDRKKLISILTAEVEAKKNAVCAGAPEEPKVTRHSILATADSTVNGARADVYGGPEDSFKLIASFWEPYIAAKCVGQDADVRINPEDVAVLMSLMKVARLTASPNHEDSWVDLAGYAACGAELACRGGAV